jgi:hypothetical protein
MKSTFYLSDILQEQIKMDASGNKKQEQIPGLLHSFTPTGPTKKTNKI